MKEINPQIQETQQTEENKHTQKIMPRNITVKLLKNQNIKRKHEISQREEETLYAGNNS